MFFTTKEVVRWLGLTVFEIWVNLIAFLLFTILLALKYNPDVELYSHNWWLIFSPLFVGDAVNTYFCIILFIRMLLELSVRYSMLRLTWSATFLLTTFLFKYLLCKKLLGQLSLDYSEVFAPLYILLQLIAVRACQQEG
ncbi:transmembrane protein 203-like isoform X2 [Coccinella septempunctata]|uniref:transmembrane protein 203-like isoform X2 n=1 Tax=Coccinella septempunctata TaxID=41139 RepID=UPI001D0821B8|nr:transmembrane protein 203-like isoform X2 [Coccinella septempunctata]